MLPKFFILNKYIKMYLFRNIVLYVYYLKWYTICVIIITFFDTYSDYSGFELFLTSQN